MVVTEDLAMDQAAAHATPGNPFAHLAAVPAVCRSPRRRLGPTSCSSFIVIPARLASTRLPRKLLLRETGKPLIQHTYEAAQKAKRPAGICVATDHEEIFDAVRGFGGQVEMTNPAAASGTDRVAEVARRLPDDRHHRQCAGGRAGDWPASRSTWPSGCWKSSPRR